jgi:DNA topoisomerase III
VIEGKRGFGCSGWREGCPFVLWRESDGHVLGDDQIRRLLQHRAIPSPNASAKLDGEPTSAPAAGFGSVAIGPCPLCKSEVVEQEKSYARGGWRQGCKFAIWKTIAGKRISIRAAQALLRQDRTPVLKGFESKAGKTFEARLKLDAGEVRFDFGT